MKWVGWLGETPPDPIRSNPPLVQGSFCVLFWWPDQGIIFFGIAKVFGFRSCCSFAQIRCGRSCRKMGTDLFLISIYLDIFPIFAASSRSWIEDLGIESTTQSLGGWQFCNVWEKGPIKGPRPWIHFFKTIFVCRKQRPPKLVECIKKLRQKRRSWKKTTSLLGSRTHPWAKIHVLSHMKSLTLSRYLAPLRNVIIPSNFGE